MTQSHLWLRPLGTAVVLASVGVMAACRATNPPLAEAPLPVSTTLAPASFAVSPAPPVEEQREQRVDGPITLQRAIEVALESNPDLSMALARVARSLAELETAEASDLPSLGVSLSYLRADAPSMYLFRRIDAGRFQPGTDFNDPGAFTDFNAALNLNYNLYDGGVQSLQKEIAAQGVEAAKLERSSAELVLISGVIDSWYAVMEAGEQVETARSSQRLIAAQLEAARAGYEAGSLLKTDVLSLQVRLAEAREFVLRAQNGEQLARTVLVQWMGLGHDAQLELMPGEVSWGVTPADRDEAFARAFHSRLEPALSRARLGQARGQLDMASSAWKPRADFFASGWKDSPDFDFNDSRDNWALGVSLSWAVFDGTRGPGKERARAMVEEASRGEQKAWLAIELDVQQAWLGLENAAERQAVAATAVASAEENLALVQAQYDSGAVPITRFLEAEVMKTRARMRQTTAGYDLQRSRAALARALGELGQTSTETLEQDDKER